MPDNDKKEMLFIFYFLVSKKKKNWGNEQGIQIK